MLPGRVNFHCCAAGVDSGGRCTTFSCQMLLARRGVSLEGELSWFCLSRSYAFTRVPCGNTAPCDPPFYLRPLVTERLRGYLAVSEEARESPSNSQPYRRRQGWRLRRGSLPVPPHLSANNVAHTKFLLPRKGQPPKPSQGNASCRSLRNRGAKIGHTLTMRIRHGDQSFKSSWMRSYIVVPEHGT